ncbi:hypothetical protein NCCP691_27600 [Noviherbaspirillum aridicola]|uniref:Uncharacterized protein n=2 Tax=Noviherbaspirillum aridicola TaxID=2849687 RepID=A0ABQ4Q6W3_9BURK|nr:hypothetical protein NCCP691_27600 [Noviherbaspirillum aridicola]
MPVIPALDVATTVCEWVMPKTVLPQRHYARTCTALPPGRPDCLSVSIEHGDEGTERSVAALYGERACLIHYSIERG